MNTGFDMSAAEAYRKAICGIEEQMCFFQMKHKETSNHYFQEDIDLLEKTKTQLLTRLRHTCPHRIVACDYIDINPDSGCTMIKYCEVCFTTIPCNEMN